jgi:hypothetical protein
MLRVSVLCIVGVLLAGCGGKPKCDSDESQRLVLESVEKTVKKQLAMRLNPSITGDEWQNGLSPEDKEMVEFNYKEYGPMLENIVTIKGEDKGESVQCMAELRFRNAQKFNLYYVLQKDTNGKLHATVEWR